MKGLKTGYLLIVIKLNQKVSIVTIPIVPTTKNKLRITKLSNDLSNL